MGTTLKRPQLRARLIAGDPPEWLVNHPRREYVSLVTLSCPPWQGLAELRKLHDLAQEKTRITGIKHVVDHVLPIQHHLFCGLTVPWNLRVIPAAMNAKKSNSVNAELFEHPEQLRL